MGVSSALVSIRDHWDETAYAKFCDALWFSVGQRLTSSRRRLPQSSSSDWVVLYERHVPYLMVFTGGEVLRCDPILLPSAPGKGEMSLPLNPGTKISTLTRLWSVRALKNRCLIKTKRSTASGHNTPLTPQSFRNQSVPLLPEPAK